MGDFAFGEADAECDVGIWTDWIACQKDDEMEDGETLPASLPASPVRKRLRLSQAQDDVQFGQ